MQSKISFLKSASRVMDLVIKAQETKQDVSLVLMQCDHPTFIKSSEGHLLITNHVYNQTFLKGESPAGRLGSKYLDSSTAKLSLLTDEMILDEGAAMTFVSKTSLDLKSGFSRIDVVKFSLIGCGHPTFSICRLALKRGH